MKIIKKEIKTIFDIKISTTDFYSAKRTFFENETFQIVYDGAFKNSGADIEKQTILETIEEMKENAKSNRYGFLAEYFGFDGWVNAGYFNKRTKTLDMVVFNYGDEMK